jgi:hypothetical protein
MFGEPTIERRKEQPYMAIRTKLNMKDVPNILPPLIPEVLQWIDKNKLHRRDLLFSNIFP